MSFTPFRKEFPLIHPKHFFQSSRTLHYLGSAFGYDLYHDTGSPSGDKNCLQLVHGPQHHNYYTVHGIVERLMSDKLTVLDEAWNLPMLAVFMILMKHPSLAQTFVRKSV